MYHYCFQDFSSDRILDQKSVKRKNITKHPTLGFHLSKTKKIIIFKYFTILYNPLGSVFNSQNKPFLLKGAPRNPISLNTPLLGFIDQKLRK